MRDVASGLARVDLLKPGSGWVDLTASVTALGAAAQLEAGYRATEDVSLAAFVKASSTWRGDWLAVAGVGIKW